VVEVALEALAVGPDEPVPAAVAGHDRADAPQLLLASGHGAVVHARRLDRAANGEGEGETAALAEADDGCARRVDLRPLGQGFPKRSPTPTSAGMESGTASPSPRGRRARGWV